MSIQSYRDLKFWQDEMTLTKQCYHLTPQFPTEEMFGRVSQIRRASSSIPANIAESNGRENTKDYIRFLRNSKGSLKELETHVILACQVGIASKETKAPLPSRSDELGRMIRALIRALQSKLIP